MGISNAKRWTVVFRALSNINRLKVIEFLSSGERKNVTEITEHLGISFKATSNHLALLKNLDVVESLGTEGHVLYFLNSRLPADFQKTVRMLLQ